MVGIRSAVQCRGVVCTERLTAAVTEDLIYYILAERETGKRGNRLIRPERPLPKPGAPAEAEPGLGRPSSSHWRRGGGLSNSVADPSHFGTDADPLPLTNGSGSGSCYFRP